MKEPRISISIFSELLVVNKNYLSVRWLVWMGLRSLILLVGFGLSSRSSASISSPAQKSRTNVNQYNHKVLQESSAYQVVERMREDS